MSILDEIAKRLRGGGCERLVKQTGNEVAITGAGLGVGNYKINLASFSNKIREFYKVTNTMVAMDNTQYLLCNEISHLDDNQRLKEDCIRTRLMLILAYNQLQAILSIPKTDELRKELTKWVRYMTMLQRQAISSLKPGTRTMIKGGKSELIQVIKYHGIDEEQLERAINLVG